MFNRGSTPDEGFPLSEGLQEAERDIGRALERVARIQPHAVAIHAPGRSPLKYGDLGTQLRYVRDRLATWGIGPGDLIVGLIPLRPEMAVACATIPSAATFAPLAPSLAFDNYVELLARLRPKALLICRGLEHPARAAARRYGVAEIDLAPEPHAPAGMFTLELTSYRESLTRAASSRPEWAYVLATSGTTGRKKLVPVSHRRVLLNASSQGRWLRFTASDVSCQMLPAHNSLGLNAALLLPLLEGACVACLPDADINGFFAALEEYGITWLPAVFTVYREILQRAPDFRRSVAGNRLRLMRVASGRLSQDEIDCIEGTFDAPLLTGFAMSEAYTITHEPLPPGIRKPGSVGVSLRNEIAIMSEPGKICATGDLGEIIVRGPLVFDGYFDDAPATAAAFIDGWLRTGDLGRLDEDGHLFLGGRLKELINRGGEKISPAELDLAMQAIPGVRAAAAFAVPHPTLGEEVVAAVAKHGDAAVTESDIIDHVRQRLGSGHVPRRVYFVDDLPVTELGKVRRSELPGLLGLDRRDSAPLEQSAKTTPVPEFSPLEAALAGLWTSVLQIASVGPHDNFMLLGGDSLRAARLLSSINAVFGVELPMETLFHGASTVAGMARAIEAASKATSRSSDDLATKTSLARL